MESMYWILMLDSIVGILTGFIVLFAVIVVAYCIILAIGKSDNEEDMVECSKRGFKWSIPILVIISLLCAFTPNTKQMLTILGVGGTIEYLKDNDTAKQLPDKCIIALDKLVDEYIEDDEK